MVSGEYRYGIRQPRHRARYERWLAAIIATCRVLAVDEATAEHYADVRDELKRKGRPIPVNDLRIAALVRPGERRHSAPDRDSVGFREVLTRGPIRRYWQPAPHSISALAYTEFCSR